MLQMKLSFFSLNYPYSDILCIYKKHIINFICFVDRIMDFNEADPINYGTKIPANKMQLFSYIIRRLAYIRGLILELGRDFPIELKAINTQQQNHRLRRDSKGGLNS